jgi:hypothetical protein
VVLRNRGPREQRITTTAREIGVGVPGPFILRDRWTHRSSCTNSRIDAVVPAQGVALFVLRSLDQPAE